MEILAANTDKSVMLQLDVGTCLEEATTPSHGSTKTLAASGVFI